MTYQYKVDGVAYVSTRIGFNENLYASKKEAQAGLDATGIPFVRVDPLDPSIAWDDLARLIAQFLKPP